jgi:hypothetical protein
MGSARGAGRCEISTSVPTALTSSSRGGTMFRMPDGELSYVDTQAPGLGVRLVPSRRRMTRTGFVVALVAICFFSLVIYALTR